MKNTIGRKILAVILIPFLILFGVLLVITAYSVSQYVTDWTELELRGISEINAADLSGRVYSVKISVLAAADGLDVLNMDEDGARVRAEGVIKAMFENEYVYNSWLACEPGAFDGRDPEHTSDYPGAPSGRFIRSYIMDGGEIIVAPDMDEETLDNPAESPWYVIPRDSGSLYIDIDNAIPNLYDYGLGLEPVYTLSIVAPIHKDGRVIGCVGADMLFDVTTFGIDNNKQAAVAVFYPNGRIFYSPDFTYAEESVDTLGFNNTSAIKEAMSENRSLFLQDEYSMFLGTRSFTYFQPIYIEDSAGSPYLCTAIPRAGVFTSIRPVYILIASVAAALVILSFAMFVYVTFKISRPLRSLTLAADAISQGDLETEIAFFLNAKDEIGLLSRSLHRMVEQFRVYILRLEQTQEEMAVFSQLGRFLHSNNPERILREVSNMLCDHFRLYRTSIIQSSAGKARVLSQYDAEQGLRISISDAPDFLQNTQVEALLAGKKLVFMNSHVISQQDSRFLGRDTLSACIVPLRAEQNLLGYILLEGNEKSCSFDARAESLLIYVAETLSGWFEERMGIPDAPEHPPAAAVIPAPAEQEEEAPDAPPSPLDALRKIGELDVDSALDTMGGLTEIYEQSVMLFAKLLPENIDNLDSYLTQDIKRFAIDIHGLKGSLNNIGAYALGSSASWLEHASKSGNSEACAENFPEFRQSLVELHDKLTAVFGVEKEKKPGDICALADALQKAEASAREYDALGALEYVRPLTGYAFDEETEAALDEIVAGLEVFDCEIVISVIQKLRERDLQ